MLKYYHMLDYPSQIMADIFQIYDTMVIIGYNLLAYENMMYYKINRPSETRDMSIQNACQRIKNMIKQQNNIFMTFLSKFIPSKINHPN